MSMAVISGRVGICNKNLADFLSAPDHFDILCNQSVKTKKNAVIMKLKAIRKHLHNFQ